MHLIQAERQSDSTKLIRGISHGKVRFYLPHEKKKITFYPNITRFEQIDNTEIQQTKLKNYDIYKDVQNYSDSLKCSWF